MADCHVEWKKPAPAAAAAMELHAGTLRKPANGVQKDIGFDQRAPNSNGSRCNANPNMKAEKRDGNHGNGTSTAGNGNAGTEKAKVKGDASSSSESSPSNSVNQNGVLYVGAGRVSGAGSHRRTKSMSMVYNGTFDGSDVSPDGINTGVRGSFRSTKSSESDPTCPLRNIGDGTRSRLKLADNGHVDNSAISDAGKVTKSNVENNYSAGKVAKSNVENNSSVGNGVHTIGSNVMGIGNIMGRGAIHQKQAPSAQGTFLCNSLRNSAEINLLNGGLSNGNANQSSRVPRHSRAHSMGGIGLLNSFNPQSLNDFGNGCIKGISPSRVEDSNGRINPGVNLPRGGRTATSGNSNNFPTNGTNKINGRAEPGVGSMGNILNPNHVRSNSHGNILDFGNVNKVVGKDNPRNGFDSTDNDLVGDSALMKKGLSSMNSEEVKNIGNEFYKKGSFADALSLYERAIYLCPGQASYHSNKAAALIGLRRLPEAVYECEEAVKLDSLHVRAHQRVAALYLRLGLVESSKLHFQAAGQNNPGEFQRVEQVKRHISRCIEMRRANNWDLVVKECDAATVAGADSAPQVIGYKAEALLKLQKPEEADKILPSALKTDVALTKLGITPPDSFLYVIRANIDLALGRFEDAVMSSESALHIDPNKKELTMLLRKAHAVSHARKKGNELFKAGKYMEASAAYGEGLESDPRNPVLLCNRAACRSKFGQWEKAFEDCNAALNVQPNYTKALMRRADCNSKLERWQDALNDYEALSKEVPGDADVARGLQEAQAALQKSQTEQGFKEKFTGDIVEVSSKEQFNRAVAYPGMVVIQFIAKWDDRCREISPFMNKLCKRYRNANFLKVDVEESPLLAKLESVSCVPTLRIYKNGSKLKEIFAPSEEMLENTMQQLHL